MDQKYFQSFFIGSQLLDIVIDNCARELYEHYLDKLSMLHSVNYGMELSGNLAYNYSHDQTFLMEEDSQEPPLFVENFAPFTLKYNVVYKKVEVEVSPASNIQFTLTDDRVSKKSSIRRYQPSSSRSIPKANTVPVPPPEPETLFTQVPLPTERIGTAQRADFMVEEKMRVKKDLELFQEEKIKREKKYQQREKRKQAKLQQKILSDLRNKQFTFDYEGSIMMRGKKATNPSVKILKEVSFSAEINKQNMKFPEKPMITNITRERRVYSMDVTTKHSDRNENGDPYNNGGNRQTSVIPFIRLTRGVTIKEKSNGGKETVVKGQSFLEHDESYRNFIMKSQSNSLQRPFEGQLHVSSQTDHSIQDVSSQVDDITLPPIMPQGQFMYKESHRYYSFHQRHLHLQKIKKRAKQIPTDTFDFQQEMDRLKSHIQSDPSLQEDIDMINIKQARNHQEKINFMQSKAKVIKILQE